MICTYDRCPIASVLSLGKMLVCNEENFYKRFLFCAPVSEQDKWTLLFKTWKTFPRCKSFCDLISRNATFISSGAWSHQRLNYSFKLRRETRVRRNLHAKHYLKHEHFRKNTCCKLGENTCWELCRSSAFANRWLQQATERIFEQIKLRCNCPAKAAVHPSAKVAVSGAQKSESHRKGPMGCGTRERSNQDPSLIKASTHSLFLSSGGRHSMVRGSLPEDRLKCVDSEDRGE